LVVVQEMTLFAPEAPFAHELVHVSDRIREKVRGTADIFRRKRTLLKN
jgi:hypothetical protein